MSKQTDKLTNESQSTFWQWDFLMSDSFVSFFDLIPEAGIISDESGKIILTNQTAQRLFNYSQKEFLEVEIEELVPPKIKIEHIKMRRWFFENPKPRFLEGRDLDLQARKKGGELFPIESALFAIHTDRGVLAANLLRDVSFKTAEQKTITEYAFVDALTNLPNLRFLQANLKRIAAKAKRHQEAIGVLFIDLDKFKPINDNQGHQIGDVILQQVSARLLSTVREEDLLARVGGDEFISLVYPASDTDALCGAAQRIIDACRQPFEVDNQTFQISASIGVCMSEKGDIDTQELIHNADKAMYQAKDKGGDCFVSFKSS
ncbi:MAG: sensor domain-containing diguanylate cyclase [Coxiellaceae bacterium]|nr:sensor domain-containing diguanylate cyclase [Coxiellaceae bacterium]